MFLKCYKTIAFYHVKRTCPIPWISCLPPGCGPRGLHFDKHSLTFAPKKVDPRKTHIKITFYVENRFFTKNKPSKRLEIGNETQIREANSMGGLFIFTGPQKLAKTMGGLHFHDFRDAKVWEGLLFSRCSVLKWPPLSRFGLVAASWGLWGASGGPGAAFGNALGPSGASLGSLGASRGPLEEANAT